MKIPVSILPHPPGFEGKEDCKVQHMVLDGNKLYLVRGRDIHALLHVKASYTEWIKRLFARGWIIESVDVHRDPRILAALDAGPENEGQPAEKARKFFGQKRDRFVFSLEGAIGCAVIQTKKPSHNSLEYLRAIKESLGSDYKQAPYHWSLPADCHLGRLDGTVWFNLGRERTKPGYSIAEYVKIRGVPDERIRSVSADAFVALIQSGEMMVSDFRADPDVEKARFMASSLNRWWATAGRVHSN